MKRSKNITRRHTRNQALKTPGSDKLTFLAHVHELRKRVFFVAIAVGIFAGIAYSMEQMLTRWLLAPAAGQQFIYTTPGGGFDFLFKLCLYSGIAASIPVIVYQLFRYINPLLKNESRRFMAWCTVWSSALAALGIAFGYFFGLPAAMRFLLKGFSSEQIAALITIQSYMSFVLVYLLGAALLFQIPLILILTNRIKPLKPRTLMKYQRWVIVGAFIIGAVISPTPDMRNQLMLSVPVIFMYEISIVLIWAINRRRQKPRKVVELLKKDTALRTDRLVKFEQAQMALQQKYQQRQAALHASTTTAPSANVAPPVPANQPAASQNTRRTVPTRPRVYLGEFTRPSYNLPRQAPQS